MIFKTGMKPYKRAAITTATNVQRLRYALLQDVMYPFPHCSGHRKKGRGSPYSITERRVPEDPGS